MTRDVEECFGLLSMTLALIGAFLLTSSLILAKRLDRVMRVAA